MPGSQSGGAKYRADRGRIVERVKRIIAAAGFQARDGLCAVEARPPIGWDKGQAALQIVRQWYGPAWSERVRVVYAGDSSKRKIRLMANEGIEVHPFIVKEFPSRPVEFDIPSGAVQTGELNLSWYREPGLGGNGRGCQISEVWLIKTGSKPSLPSTGGRDADKR